LSEVDLDVEADVEADVEGVEGVAAGSKLALGAAGCHG